MKEYEQISYAKTVYGEEEIADVVKCLGESTQMGNYSRKFESKIADLFEKKHCLYVNSGSSALFIGVEAFNFPKGSEVITPALTFSTSIGCLIKNNLIPVFTDVEPLTYCIDVSQIENLINEKTVAILAPNLMGNLCDWPAIKEIAERYNLVVIEDSADTLGATIKGKSSGFYTDMSITSFYGSHIISCGGNGGMFLTNNKDYSKLRLTVDEIKDFILIEKLILKCGDDKGWNEYVKILKNNPELVEINSSIMRNEGYQKTKKVMKELMPKNAKYIVVDYNDLVTEPEIEIIFSENPDRIFDAFARAIKEALQTRFPEYAEKIKEAVRVRIANFPLERSLRPINAETIGSITSVSGMVVRASEVKPLAKELVFVCPDEHTTKIIQLKGMDAKEPVVCDNPNCKQRDFELKPESRKCIDFQILRLQELPEDLPPGQLPHYIDVTIRQDLVDNSRPGDRIILTGVVRVEQESVTGVQRGHSGLYRLRIEGNNIEFLSGRGSKTDRKIGREEISPEEEKRIKSLSQSSDVYQRLIDSFPPHIQG